MLSFTSSYLKPLLTLIILFSLVGIPNMAAAQLLPENKAAEEPVKEVPDDSLGRRTPRGTVSGFLQAVADQNYMRASYYLDLKRSFRKETERKRIVTVLQRLLDRGNIMPYALISNKSTGRTDDDLEPGQDLIGTVTSNGEVINLLVENKEAEGAASLWLFSAETIDAIAVVTVEDALLVDKMLPDVLKENNIGGVPVGHWLAVLVLIIVAYLLSWSVIALISFLLSRLWRKARTERIAAIIQALSLPLRLYLAVWVFVALSQQVGISIIVRQRFSAITVIIGIIAFLILLWRLADFISTYSQKKMTRRGRVSAISIILFMRRMAKVAIIIFGAIAILGTIGVDVTAGIAALGIGGIALALGAQKTVENFVGSVTLIADQPIRVGDFCKVGDVTGTVEAIGMRSTRIRTGERTIVTIPNGQFSSDQIENFAHRDRFLFNPALEFRLETTPDQLRYLLVELRALLYAHPMVSPDPAKVRFSGITASAYKLDVWAYITAPNFDAYQEAQEDILLHILDIVAQSGTDFAYPSQTLYFARDKGVDEEKTNEAVEKVKRWRQENKMQLPSFDSAYIDEIKDSVPYPPEGSVVKKEGQKK